MAKKKSKSSQNALVVYQQRQVVQTQPRRQKKKKKAAGKSRRDPTTDAYRSALQDPLSQRALGARVPDMFAAATVTAHYSESLNVFSGPAGLADLVIIPNMAMPWISPRGSVSGVVWTTMSNTGSGTCSWLAGSLGSRLTNYRIVGYGVKVYSVSSYSGSAGRVLAATFPVSSWVNYKPAPIGGQATSSVNSSATPGATLSAYGVPNSSDVVAGASLPAMVNCLETSLTSLATTPVIITPKVSSPEAFNFRQSADSAIGFDINNQTSASFVSSGDASYLRVSGHEGVVISVVGATINTSILQVEICYHLEGMPPSGSNFQNDSPSVVANPTAMAEIVAAASRSPTFRNGVELAGNFVFPGLGTLARSLM